MDTGSNLDRTAEQGVRTEGSLSLGVMAERIVSILSKKNFKKSSQVTEVGRGQAVASGLRIIFIVWKSTLGEWKFLEIISEKYFSLAALTA